MPSMLLAVGVVIAALTACAILAMRLGFEAIIETYSAPFDTHR